MGPSNPVIASHQFPQFRHMECAACLSTIQVSRSDMAKTISPILAVWAAPSHHDPLGKRDRLTPKSQYDHLALGHLLESHKLGAELSSLGYAAPQGVELGPKLPEDGQMRFWAAL
jgi:hypothetical protein